MARSLTAVAWVRTVRAASGVAAMRIVHGSRPGARNVEHLSSAHDAHAVEALKALARQGLAGGHGKPRPRREHRHRRRR